MIVWSQQWFEMYIKTGFQLTSEYFLNSKDLFPEDSIYGGIDF